MYRWYAQRVTSRLTSGSSEMWHPATGARITQAVDQAATRFTAHVSRTSPRPNGRAQLRGATQGSPPAGTAGSAVAAHPGPRCRARGTRGVSAAAHGSATPRRSHLQAPNLAAELGRSAATPVPRLSPVCRRAPWGQGRPKSSCAADDRPPDARHRASTPGRATAAHPCPTTRVGGGRTPQLSGPTAQGPSTPEPPHAVGSAAAFGSAGLPVLRITRMLRLPSACTPPPNCFATVLLSSPSACT